MTQKIALETILDLSLITPNVHEPILQIVSSASDAEIYRKIEFAQNEMAKLQRKSTFWYSITNWIEYGTIAPFRDRIAQLDALLWELRAKELEIEHQKLYGPRVFQVL